MEAQRCKFYSIPLELFSKVRSDFLDAVILWLILINRKHRSPLEKCQIVRIQYFVRGGFVGHRSRASSKHLSPSSSGRRARFLGGQKGVALQVQDARVGVGSTKKPTRC
ncbi:uncharacterized protein TNCV_4189651 [Trichonephila clavipes]|nr:uncharacterized protein TNCV_4189651 [Trichonephila clavipes]